MVAVTRFGPGLALHEPIGALCAGCGREILYGQRGYAATARSLPDEVWHRSCFHEAAVLSETADWVTTSSGITVETI